MAAHVYRQHAFIGDTLAGGITKRTSLMAGTRQPKWMSIRSNPQWVQLNYPAIRCDAMAAGREGFLLSSKRRQPQTP